jgi:IclR family KDG regulon transcriptional repressor
MLNTILKASDVLDLFTKETPEWGVAELAAQLGLAKSSAHDLMATLAHIGLLSQTNKCRYRLGWRLVTLLATTELRAVARPLMEQLKDHYQETIHLALLDKGMVVYLDKLEGTQTIRVALTSLGTRLYPHCSGLGKVLLSSLTCPQVEQIVNEQGLPRFTDNTITELAKLHEELRKVRQQGYATDMEEIVQDLSCVAAPIRDSQGKIIAAISMSIPAYRFHRSQKEFATAIMRTGKMISTQLGYYD